MIIIPSDDKLLFQKYLVFVIAVLFISNSTLAFAHGGYPGGDKSTSETGGPKLDYTIHAPIRIDSNSDFETSTGVIAGNGSEGDPYMIGGWNISGSGLGYCIFIGNTTDHFIVRNNYLHDSIHYYEPYAPGGGMCLYNVTNGSVYRNICDNAAFGYYANQTRDGTTIPAWSTGSRTRTTSRP